MQVDDHDRLVDGMTIEVYDSTGKKTYAKLKAGPTDWGFLHVPWYYPLGWWFRNKYYGAYLWLIKRGILTKMAEMDAYNSANREKP